MIEAVSLTLLYWAAALLHGSDRRSRRGGVRLALLSTRLRIGAARAAAVVFTALAGFLWARTEPGPAAYFMVVAGLMALGTLVALVGAVAPRLVWMTAALAGVSSMLSAVWGGLQ